MKYIVNDDVVLSRPLEGPLSAQIAAFAQWARDQGYAWASRYRQVQLAACFSRWLGQRAVSAGRVSAEHQARYLRFRARRLQVRREDAAALGQFFGFLRNEGVIPSEKAPRRLTPVERDTQAFETYLRDDRVLAEATIAYYVPFVRGFLTARFGKGRVTLSRLCAGDVVRFVQRQAARLHVKRAKQLTTALRSFLHYARYRGDIALDLAAAVPTVANWSMSSIPRAIPADAVRQLLASIRRRTVVGRRNYAILLVLARLGLRASELVRLELDDIDWDAGQVSVRGKGGYRTALPLPADVGEALAAYSRKSVRLLVWRSSTQIWAELHERAFRRLGGTVRVIVLDYVPSHIIKEQLEDFRRIWRYHHPLTVEQLAFAGRPAIVQKVAFYHGGDVLYTLNRIPGMWHEQCLVNPD
jgi:integrase/recombinase XerD